jgi:hypothetical protein
LSAAVEEQEIGHKGHMDHIEKIFGFGELAAKDATSAK